MAISFSLITTIATTITALATSISVILVWNIYKPDISIWFEPDKNNNLIMNLVIENIGQSIAKDVKFIVCPDFEIIEGRYLSQIGLFKNGLEVFPPHRKIVTYLTWMPKDYERKISEPFTISVTYKGFLNKEYTKNYTIDLSFFGEVPISPHILKDVAENLKGIKEAIDSKGGD